MIIMHHNVAHRLVARITVWYSRDARPWRARNLYLGVAPYKTLRTYLSIISYGCFYRTGAPTGRYKIQRPWRGSRRPPTPAAPAAPAAGVSNSNDDDNHDNNDDNNIDNNDNDNDNDDDDNTSSDSWYYYSNTKFNNYSLLLYYH